MSIIVQKFGGTSMADPRRIGKAADRVVAARRAGHDVVVVVSAMGRTTDQLLELADQVTSEPCERERDMLVTAGERIATALLCMALQARECESISFTGSQAGILTNDRHRSARIIEVRPVRVQDELERGKVVVVAGYQGVSYRRDITSLGRGGSDTTAVALAAALGAEAVEIYSDVDGVYSADPRAVPDAVRLDELDTDAMAALAAGGARVLAADAVRYAHRAGIALYCRATDPARGGTGQTLVRRFPPDDPGEPRVLAVAGDGQTCALVRCPADALEGLRSALAAAEPQRMAVVGGEAALVIPREAADGVMEGAGVRVVAPVGRLTLAGRRLTRLPALSFRLTELLRAQGCEPWGLWTNDASVVALIPPDRLDELVAACHAQLVDRN